MGCIFYDDFNGSKLNANKWGWGKNLVSVADSILVLDPASGYTAFVQSDYSDPVNYKYELLFKWKSNTDLSITIGQCGFSYVMKVGSSIGFEFDCSDWDNGSVSTNLKPNTWYSTKIRKTDSKIEHYVDGIKTDTFDCDNYCNTGKALVVNISGTTSGYSGSGSKASIQDIRLVKK